MSDEHESKSGFEEKRSYFRVDDMISVVANPVHVEKEKAENFRKSVVSSRAFSISDMPGISGDELDENITERQEDTKLYSMMTEIKTKLDFIIHHFMLEKEGLLESEKKFVNISAAGIRFTVNSPVNVKDIMEIKLLLPTYPPVAVFAYGEVKRVKTLDENKFEVALEYINMGESVRNEIIQYTLSHQRETIRKFKESEPGE
jgi:c-di-GMP-binding flagellar brake protein YcgR